MERVMHPLGDFYLRLDHVTLVSPLLGNQGGFVFSVVLLGNYTHAFAYSSNEEAKAAHDALLRALQERG